MHSRSRSPVMSTAFGSSTLLVGSGVHTVGWSEYVVAACRERSGMQWFGMRAHASVVKQGRWEAPEKEGAAGHVGLRRG